MRKIFIALACLLFSCLTAVAQAGAQSELHQRAAEADKQAIVPTARFYYIRAFEDYVSKGQLSPAMECAVKAAGLYHKESYWKEAFDLLRRADQAVQNANTDARSAAALHYTITKERLAMYVKMKKSQSAMDQIDIMEQQAATSGKAEVQNDLLYQKAICYYTFGLSAKGDAVFKQMAGRLTALKEYDKVDQAYQTLIASGRRSGSASLVAQSYRSYIEWKDSVSAMKTAAEMAALKKKIDQQQTTIDEQQSSLSARAAVIAALGVLAVALAVALAVGALVLMRFVLRTRKQKKTIDMLQENNALKAHFIGNISAQLIPTLQKLDSRQPEVKALLLFAEHVQTLSELEQTVTADVELQDTQIPQFCEMLMEQIRDKVKPDVSTAVDAQKLSVKINREYVQHILAHLLQNAAEFAPQGGKVTLDFKKRSAHTFQFIVTNSGEPIPAGRHNDVFKPFLEQHDLTQGDGLGLPICKQMALKMKGDLYIDPAYTKGTRFVLELHAKH
ncbi:MAG: sensor histidine kinase [Prevotella sp.]|nr:sensor histidine kinase [Prevotella sp.]